MTWRDEICDPPPAMVASAINGAIDLIAEGGHCKGRAEDTHNGRTAYCIAGALAVTCHTRRDGRKVYPGVRIFDAARRAVSGVTPPRYASMVSFNDHPKTTKADVLLLLATAARTAREVEA